VSIRTCRVEDLIAIQSANLQTLPENYNAKYFSYHLLRSAFVVFSRFSKQRTICSAGRASATWPRITRCVLWSREAWRSVSLFLAAGKAGGIRPGKDGRRGA
jgi:hypothetical protein